MTSKRAADVSSIATEFPLLRPGDLLPLDVAIVRPMSEADTEAVQAVELDAGERFRAFPDRRVAACADHPPFPADELRDHARAGRAWVAVDGGTIVGFLVAEEVDQCGHVEELAVSRSHGRQGIASELLDTVAAWAVRARLPALTLTTFRDVPWNRAFYERRGFLVLPPPEWTAGLRTKVEEEAQFGLPPELRVVMRRDLTGDGVAGDRFSGSRRAPSTRP